MKGIIVGPGGRLDLLFLEFSVKRSFMDRAMKMDRKRNSGL